MKKLLSILAFLALTAVGYGQAKIAADGSIEPTGNFPALKDQHLKGSMRVVADTASRNAIPSLFRKQGMLVQTITPFTLWRLDSTSSPIWQPFTTGSTTTSLPWDSITGKPVNFSTTYALMNDGKDSIDSKVSIARVQTITGIKTFTERLNVLAGATGGATAVFNSTANGGNEWSVGAFSSVNDIPSAFGFYNVTQNTTPLVIAPTKMQFVNPFQVVWTIEDAGYADSGYPNAAIAWDSANRLQINNGTAGQYADLKLRNLQLTGTAGTGTRMVVADASGNITTQTIPSSPVTSVFGRTGTVTAQSGDYSVAQITGLQTALDAKQNTLGYTAENTANKGVANGYADLDANGKVPASRIDFGQTGQTFVVASQSEMLAISGANVGALAIRTDQNRNYRLIAQPASTLANWIMLLSPDAPVQSVNGQTGNVNLLTTNIGEGTNLYYTDARARGALSAGTGISYNSSTGVISSTITQYTDALARAALSFTAGSGGYNSSTGVITIPTNTNQLTNGAGFITGINSSMVTTALGYTPPQPNGTGASGTWGINISGNAASATNTLAWNGEQLDYSSIYNTAPDFIIGYASARTRPFSVTAIRSFLGLGSYAYRSSGLAELSGATFTGTITAPYGYFSGTGSGGLSSLVTLNNTTSSPALIAFQNTVNGHAFGFNSTGTQRFVFINGSVAEVASISSTGAATFSSSVTGAGFISSGTVRPSSNYAADLGSSSIRWASLWAFDANFASSVTATSATLSASDISLNLSNSATSRNLLNIQNNSGRVLLGVESSTGGTIITGATAYATVIGTPNSTALQFGTNDAIRLTIANNGAITAASSVTATSFFESSDLRQKNVHTTLISKDGINPIQYTFIPDGKQKWGYGAQQVQGILPYAVHEDDKGFLKVDYTTVHTYKIAMLEQRIAELEKQKEHTAHLAARVMDLQAQILELKNPKK